MTDLVDARGLRCPLPVLKAEKRIASLPPGGRFVVLATDPVARIDIPHLCQRHGLACTTQSEGETLRFEILRPA